MSALFVSVNGRRSVNGCMIANIGNVDCDFNGGERVCLQKRQSYQILHRQLVLEISYLLGHLLVSVGFALKKKGWAAVVGELYSAASLLTAIL